MSKITKKDFNSNKSVTIMEDEGGFETVHSTSIAVPCASFLSFFQYFNTFQLKRMIFIENIIRTKCTSDISKQNKID